MDSILHPIENAPMLGEALGAKGVVPSLLGFGPAPAYVEKSPLQNRIAQLYRDHSVAAEKPEVEGENAPERASVYTAIALARRNQDSEALEKATARGRALGMKPANMAKIGTMPQDVFQFSKLPNADQLTILKRADKAEVERYLPKAKADVKRAWQQMLEDKGAQTANANGA
jgi:hypothetical protein